MFDVRAPRGLACPECCCPGHALIGVLASHLSSSSSRSDDRAGRRSLDRGADSASTAGELDAARRTLADAQAAANAAADAITEAEGRLEQLHERIDTLETQMTATQQRVDELALVVRRASRRRVHPRG